MERAVVDGGGGDLGGGVRRVQQVPEQVLVPVVAQRRVGRAAGLAVEPARPAARGRHVLEPEPLRVLHDALHHGMGAPDGVPQPLEAQAEAVHGVLDAPVEPARQLVEDVDAGAQRVQAPRVGAAPDRRHVDHRELPRPEHVQSLIRSNRRGAGRPVSFNFSEIFSADHIMHVQRIRAARGGVP